MWFLFGLITLISGTIYYYLKRREARWPATEQFARVTQDGVPAENMRYLQGIRSGQYGRIVQVRIGLVGLPPELDFRLHPEGLRDSLFKWIGIACEHQTGDATFDDKVYVVSDNALLCAALSHDAELRRNILTLIESADSLTAPLRSIRCRNGRLWLEFKPASGFESASARDLATYHLPYLSAIKTRLDALAAGHQYNLRDPFVWRAILLLSISSGSLVLGLSSLLRLMWSNDATLQPLELFWYAKDFGLLALAALLFAAVLLLGRSARAHLVMLEILLVGGFGFALSAFILARDINIEWDTQPLTEQTVNVHSKHKKRHRKAPDSYYLVISPSENKTGVDKLQVSRSDFNRFERGEKIRIRIGDGYLGYPWVAFIGKAAE